MRKNKLLITVRYLSLLTVIFSFISLNETLSIFIILMLLCLLINSKFRFFSLRQAPYIICSLVVDLILFICLSSYQPQMVAYYFILPILDSILLLPRRYHLSLSCLIGMILLFLISHSFTLNQITSLFVFLIVAFLGLYIKEEHEKKLDAQLLYDELRISEEKLKQAKEELELYGASITELAVLKERNRISRDIHDSVGHALSTAIIQLNAMEVIASKENSSVAPLALNLREFLKNCLQEVREAISTLKPSEYQTYQELYRIEELIENFKKLSGMNVRLTISKQKWELSPKMGLTLYRAIQETLSNALRHGQATDASISIHFSPDHVVLTAENNGIGCPNFQKGVGLTSMSERVSEVNGKVHFIPSTVGFKIRITIPKGKGESYD